MYLIGSKFVLTTDHQPLLSMFNNPNSRPPARIEHWLLYLQQFDYVMEYQPGNFNPTDYLSRHPLQHNAEHHKNAKKREHIVKAIIKESIPDAVTLTKVLYATGSDKTLQKLTGYILSGRFNSCKKYLDAKCYSSVFYEL